MSLMSIIIIWLVCDILWNLVYAGNPRFYKCNKCNAPHPGPYVSKYERKDYLCSDCLYPDLCEDNGEKYETVIDMDTLNKAIKEYYPKNAPT